jgi:hypothetical protein
MAQGEQARRIFEQAEGDEVRFIAEARELIGSQLPE